MTIRIPFCTCFAVLVVTLVILPFVCVIIEKRLYTKKDYSINTDKSTQINTQSINKQQNKSFHDIAVFSATLYPTSKSYPNNTVVILFNAYQEFHLKHPILNISSSNDSESVMTSLSVHQVVGMLPFFCKWVPFIAKGQIVEKVNQLMLSSDGSIGVKIPIRHSYNEKHPVVTCFSPMFLNERWQLLILTAEVYSYYGAFMHFYVRSMISSLYEYLVKYPNTRVSPWPGVKLGKNRANSADFDPNLELEFRNQATALTDCLLLYKESAEFIIFPDPDDIIIPRTEASYLSEFKQIFNLYPKAAIVIYNMTQTRVNSVLFPETYSPIDVLQSVRFTGETRWGKLVAKPHLIDSLWIHTSFGMKNGFEQVNYPIANNSAVHLRFWNLKEAITKNTESSKYNPLSIANMSAPDLFQKTDLLEIQKRFEDRKTKFNEIYETLPDFSIYYPLVERCYNRIYYNVKVISGCKGPEHCDIPEFPGIECKNTVSEWSTFTEYEGVYIHVLRDFHYVDSDNGCTISLKRARELILITLFILLSLIVVFKKEWNFPLAPNTEVGKAGLWTNSNLPRITILIVLSNGTDLKNYERALGSVECYSKIQGYNYQIVDDRNFMDRCPQKDKFFRRHCISALFLVKCDYLLFLDADMGVVNPKRRIEEFIDNTFDVTFYDRFFNAEIMAGTYSLKNSKVALDFLVDFSNYEPNLPNSFHGTDNGGLHALIISKLYPDRRDEYIICMKAYNVSKSYGDLFIYETCIRSTMGIGEEHGSYRFLQKGTGWARDNWLTNSMWSPESDFMIHGWKQKELKKYKKKDLPLQLTIKNRYTWCDPIVGDFHLDRCVPGNDTWNYDTNLKSEKAALMKKHLAQYKEAVQKENYQYLAKLTQKIK